MSEGSTFPVSLSSRHIQNLSDTASLQTHWGYASRAIPCTNDKGSCAYLDVVYHSHDLGMLYTFIFWAVIGATLLIWAFARQLNPARRVTSTKAEDVNQNGAPFTYRLVSSIRSVSRRHLLPERMTPIFGRVSSVQLVTLVVLLGYLLVFSLVGIVYQTWITPVKKMPGVYNTRTTIGVWGDRIGVWAYALTPLTVLLATRESLLSIITGLPYQSFNFLHRWLGYIIFIQGFLHTFSWTLVEGRFYQPQPIVFKELISEKYIIWGIVAMFLITLLLILSTQWCIRMVGYEVFRKAHYILAMLYIGACWGHWSKLYCWLLASLIVWGLDRAIRLIRTSLLHYQCIGGFGSTSMGFKTIAASITLYPDSVHGDIVRLDFEHNHEPWNIGQHFYLCFPTLSIWQAHPFTPLNVPRQSQELQRHSYIIRAKKGQTKKLADLAMIESMKRASIPVILTGPYGQDIINDMAVTSASNILCIAGGTGITFVLPVITQILRSPMQEPDRSLELIWVVRRKSDVDWIEHELRSLRSASTGLGNLTFRIFVTREDAETNPSHQETSGPYQVPQKGTAEDTVIEKEGLRPSTPDQSSAHESSDNEKSEPTPSQRFSVQQPRTSDATNSRPDLGAEIQRFVADTVSGPTKVYVSGPGGMISDVRKAVAGCNSGAKVWKGDEKYDVRLYSDDRLEW